MFPNPPGPVDAQTSTHRTVRHSVLARIIARCVPDRSDRRLAVRQAHEGRSLPFTARVSVHRSNIIAAESLIDDITLRLASQRPVHARGMARLRRLLADGRGPFYERGRGDLGGRLRAAFAAL